METYITHIRITEYSTHPSSPPPPEAVTPQSEKPRVIIVAVRKSGRVRMHKSKENPNGTFSIGKTWDLNDLSAIESYTGSTSDPQKRQWAGETGFTVVVGKPYYWQAQADKEKKFFIASLIKIYGKYTNGRMPELLNFDPRELDQVLGSRRAPAGRAPLPSSSSSRPGSGPGAAPEAPAASQSTGNLSASSVAATPASAYQPPPPRPPVSPARNLVPPNGASASPTPSMDSSRAPNQSAALRRLAGANPSQDSLAASFTTNRSDDASSIPPRSRGGMNGPGAFGRFGGELEKSRTPPPLGPPSAPPSMPPPSAPPPGPPPAQPTPPPPQPVDLPDRRRPPMDPTRPQGATDRDLVPAPLMSPGNRRDPQPPPRSMDRMSPRNNSVSKRSEPSSAPESVPEPVPEPEKPSPAAEASNDPPFVSATPSPIPDQTASPASENGDNRPGLGPMIKSQRSKVDLAGTLWKAASAAAAFKPRPGGAAERLREMQRKDSKDSSEGPDGITAVVPAPKPAPKPDTPKLAEPEEIKRGSGVPDVKVSVPKSSRPSSLQAATEDDDKNADTTRKADEQRDLAITSNDAKYLIGLGVDTNFLAGQTGDFTQWLDHLGWVPGEQMRERNFEEMKLDIDRQLNKAQAGGWVVRFEEGDERIDAIKKGLDLAITECDEMDNLLTLYTVELSVSLPLREPAARALLTLVRRSRKILPTSKPRDKVCRYRRRIKRR